MVNTRQINNQAIRENLARCYRLVAHFGLDDHTYTHLSTRSHNGDSFFLLPFGKYFAEITADMLIEVDFNGKVIAGIEEIYNPTGYIIHSAIYQERPELNFVFHLHTPNQIAVSADPRGLLPLSQHALHFYKKISYYNYDSLALDASRQKKDLAASLGDNKVMLMHNHGSLIAGETAWEAIFYLHHLELACKIQNLVLASTNQPLMPDEATCQKAVEDLLNFEENLGWRDWQAWCRKLKL